jgi:DNA-binding MarR family transcriptional regulator
MLRRVKDQARDSIDDHVDRWTAELPELIDPRVEGTISRITVLFKYLQRHRDRALTDQGLAWWEFQTLKDLRHRGAPYRATPTELADSLGLSPAATTKRLDAMERAGYLRRDHDTGDRRRVFVTLTDAGRQAWEDNIAAQDRIERRLLAALAPAEQDQLITLLRKLVRVTESPTESVTGPVTERNDDPCR